MRAVVLDDQDPQHRRRVRLSIPELLFDPETGEVLPSHWAEPTNGGFSVPPVGTQVWVQSVWSSDRNAHQLTYERGTVGADPDGTSHAPPTARGVDDESVSLKVSAPFRVPAPSTGLERKAASGGRVRRAADATQLTLNLPGSANAAPGPRNAVWKEGGFVVEVDSSGGAERFQLHHPSGASVEINAGGTWTERAAKRFAEVLEHDTSRVGGDERRRVDGHVLRGVGGNSVEDVTGRKVILAEELDLKARFDLLMQVGGQLRQRVNGIAELRALNDVRINSGGNFAAGGANDASLAAALGNARVTSAMGSVLLTAASPLGRIEATAAGGMDVRPFPVPGLDELPTHPVALAPPLLAFIASLMAQLEAVAAAIALGQPNPGPATSQVALSGLAAELGVAMTAPFLRSTTALGV
jgi:hypothetical protein